MNKEYIPSTNPKWGRELPDGDLNSLVDNAGNNYDNGYNFDERDDDEVSYSNLGEKQPFDPEEAARRQEEGSQEEQGEKSREERKGKSPEEKEDVA